MVARGIESWKSGYEKFRKSPYSSADWKPSAVAHVERSRLNGAGKNIGNLERDVCATYQNALMWAITGNEAHAEAVVEIINAWSDTFKTLYCQRGEDVPFEPYNDISGRFPASTISTSGRGKLRSIFEQVYNHYAFRVNGIPPEKYKYTKAAADKLRPEGAGFNADNAGFGTLFFSLKQENNLVDEHRPTQ